jgi:hypothetical protein
MHILAVDFARELRVTIEPCLDRAPVKAVAPIGTKLLQIAALGPIVPARAVKLVRPADAGKPYLEVGYYLTRNVASKGPNFRCH